MTSRFPTPQEFAAFPPPNYVDPGTKTVQILGILIPMTVLVIIFILARIWSRTVIVLAIGLDDWLMLVAAIIQVANNIMICISTNANFQTGYHLWDFKPEQIIGTMKAAQVGMATQLLFTVTCSITKLSVLVTYLRIFPSKFNRWFCYIMLAYTTAWLFGAFFLVLFQCLPIETYWMIFKYLHKAKCLNVKMIYYIQGGTNTLSDFLVFLWPVKYLYSVNVSLRQRVTLIAMFSFGVIICIAGSARIYYTHRYLTHYDIFWYAADVYTVMSVEASVGIACGCLPGCKPLLSRMFPRFFGTTFGDSNSRTPEPTANSNNSSHDSVPLSILSRDVVVKKVSYNVEYSDAKTASNWRSLPTPSPAPSTTIQSRRASYSRKLGLPRSGQRDGEFGEWQDDSSQELIILQGVRD